MKKHHLLFALCFGIFALALTSCGVSFKTTVASPWGAVQYDSDSRRIESAIDAGAIVRDIINEK